MVSKLKGFTLIELMIVVVIIAILVAIAYPAYTQYKIRANRADVQSEMIRIAQDLQSYKAMNQSFNGATLTKVGGSATYPRNSPIYSLVLTVATNNLSWTLTATPIVATIQKGNGIVCLNDQGQQYWDKAATACALSNISTWDGK